MFDFWREGLELVVKWNWSRMFTIWEAGKSARDWMPRWEGRRSHLRCNRDKKSSINERISNVERLVLSAFANQWDTIPFYHVPNTIANKSVSCKNVKCKTKVKSLLVLPSHPHKHTRILVSMLFCCTSYWMLSQRLTLNTCSDKSKEWIPMHSLMSIA